MKSIAQRCPLISFYVFALILSGMILAAEILSITIWSTVLWAAFAVLLLLVYKTAHLSRSAPR